MTPLTSVIIPVHNRLDLTIECLRSIEKLTGSASSYEIILVDDASSDGTSDWVRKNFPDIKIITNDVRQSFAHNNNAAAKAAKGEFLCLLNNDTIVLAGWLDEMLNIARADERVGVVGNRHIDPHSDHLNHGGMAFDQRYHPVHIYVGSSKEDPRALETRDMQCVTAACWLVRKTTFVKLGGFDTNFTNGYEDVDFCLKASAAGFRIVYVGKSAIYHYGQSSPGQLAHEEWNAQFFREKWRGRIIPDLHKFTQTPPWYAPRQGVSSPAPIRGDTDVHFAVPMQFGNAFTWSATRLAAACENAGMKVSFDAGSIHSTIDRKDRAMLKTFMKRAPSRKFQIRWGHFWHAYINRALTAETNAEFMAINYLYPPQPLHNLDFWMRHTVMNGYIKLPMSGYCAETLRNIGVPDRRNLVLHHGFSPEILKSTSTDCRFADFDFVFLAITNSHDPYRYGTDVLIPAFAKAFAGRSDVVLVLKDYGMQTGIVDAWVRSVEQTVAVRHLKEFVSKSDLISLYRSADVFVAPFRGEGFGMKIVDACAFGMPVIAPYYSGPKDFLVEDDFYSVSFSEAPVGECLDSAEGIVPPYATWCDPSEDDLAAQMIKSYEDYRRGKRTR